MLSEWNCVHGMKLGYVDSTWCSCWLLFGIFICNLFCRVSICALVVVSSRFSTRRIPWILSHDMVDLCSKFPELIFPGRLFKDANFPGTRFLRR